MENLKPIDYELLWELVRNSRRSDRELAKVLGISQPTVTRRRTVLERELIDGYTTTPKWEKLGFEILAMTFVKIRSEIAAKKEYEATRKKGLEWLMKQPKIIMAGACRGPGVDSFMISMHKSTQIMTTSYAVTGLNLENLRMTSSLFSSILPGQSF
jgi:DNA-binding Lrp family transcriptional regulator